ncbi:MAG: hypothetical protein ACI4RC_02885 [Oscillospiraceae bacterium]
MQMLFLVIKNIDLVDDIMKELAKAGIKGATAIDSVGMSQSISNMDSLPMINVLRDILNGDESSSKSKTIFLVIKDEEVEKAKDAITKVTGDLSKPNAGILFGVPITFAEGIK